MLDAYYSNIVETLKINPTFLIEATEDFTSTLRLKLADDYEEYLQEIAQDVIDEVGDVFETQYYNHYGEKFKGLKDLLLLSQDTLREWMALNISTIESYKSDYLNKFKNALYANLKYGIGLKELKKQAIAVHKKQIKPAKKEVEPKKSIIEVMADKLKNLAEDQINKLAGSVTSQIQIRQSIGYYVWVDMRDSRVRPTHRALNGKICSWSDISRCADTIEDARKGNMYLKTSIGGVALHPKMDYACRCEASPIFL
jgi:SPP1 gp7 family putative phage head morphogenesis protein